MNVIVWDNDRVRFLDQTRLPQEEQYVVTGDYRVIADAIRRLAIRGAPLIGIAAAYGAALAVRNSSGDDQSHFTKQVEQAAAELESTRPTAVNLSWALNRIRRVVAESEGQPIADRSSSLLREAHAIHDEDRAMCESISQFGAGLLGEASTILTHCNTGALATGGRGTALGMIVRAWELGKIKHVYIDETRPLLQGSRLTAWELGKMGIPHTLITDNAAAFLMQQRRVQSIVVGADRIASNGDVANKIGTYGLAVLAAAHSVPFIVAAPRSTIDWDIKSGAQIPIETRADEEITRVVGTRIAPNGTAAYAPAFDVTPHRLITAIVTDRGICRAPYRDAFRRQQRLTVDKHD
ncbi:MAG: S-methyl-5-thioribose-1-phosphate isomerase [Ignavibacteria bacterium]|nr:S-methyl-5-thioribose-1-phosphate isomerase [Ignavibacteria bacterium]